MLSNAVLVLVAAMVGQAGDRMPADLHDQIDNHLIGEWTVKTTWGDQTITGKYSARWTAGRQAVLITSAAQDKDGTAEYTELLGWNATLQELVSLTFSSRGEHGFLHWQKLSKDKWTGRGTGRWGGKEWDSPTTAEWKVNEFRYEDISDGKPFVSVFTRKS